MNCDRPAVAMLTFSPRDAKAWLYDLEQPDPTGGIMLCRKHANATVVPMSWQLIDARDPAWPGPADQQATDPETPVHALPTTANGHGAPELPSDTTAIDKEFAALQADLPVIAQPYAQPQLATSRAAGRPTRSDLVIDLGAGSKVPDPSLFELPISDIPAVTPHPGYS